MLTAAQNTVDAIFPGFYSDLINSWKERLLKENTLRFVACLSEISATDDRGRLSMWRAYGGQNGVALVMKDTLLDLDSNFINTFHSPVLYGAAAEVKVLLIDILQKIFGIAPTVATAGPSLLKERLLEALEFARLSIKHVGFEEEKEWRMIHHLSEESDYLNYRSEVVRGSAEVVCELNLASHPALHPGAMFEKVIVGPCAFQDSTVLAIRRAFDAIKGPIPPVVKSDIPLRHFR